MSQRRPERARTSQPLPTAPTHSNSSSSISSTRADRVTRSNNRQHSSNNSSTPQSLSSEEGDEPLALNQQGEPPQTRRRTRQQDTGDDTLNVEDDMDDDAAEEEEVTRCICGHQEYPGPPTDHGRMKDGQNTSLNTADISTDDIGGLFIQCDKCHVWQHGGCVGIMDEAASPDEYFCEQCRPDFHKLARNSQGQKYSQYVPIQKKPPPKTATRKSSVPKDGDDKVTSNRDRDKAAMDAAKKRRSTMNSRHFIDEEEQLMQAIEASKTDAPSVAEDGLSRRTKRSRDDSEEVEQESKRPRTGSRSPISSPALESEDETSMAKHNGKAKPRGAAAKSQREKELKDKEREREKAEAANKRKGRAERRRGDDPDPLEEPVVAAEEPLPAVDGTESQQPETPNMGAQPLVSKKNGRPPPKRAPRSRNQYTRDAPTPNALPSPRGEHSPNSPTIRVNGVDAASANTDTTVPRQTKSKNSKFDRMTWNEIRKPASVMLHYIQQRQLDMAEKGSATPAMMQSRSTANGVSGTTTSTDEPDKSAGLSKDAELAKFKNLSAVEMMDYLSRDLEYWQQNLKDC